MKIAVITGASSGIGLEFVRSLGSDTEFDELWLIARSEAKLAEAAALCTHAKARIISLDLSSPASWEKYSELLAEAKPEVGFLANCAGYGKFCAYDALSLEDSLGMIDLNCKALTAMTLKSLPYMKNGDRIIQIASAAAFQPLPYANIYAATKSYVLFYSRALNAELKSRGITVTAVCPYWVDTGFFKVAHDNNTPGVISKYEIMAKPADVVRKALADSAKGKDKSSYGFYNRLQQLGAKLAPYPVILAAWLKKQGL